MNKIEDLIGICGTFCDYMVHNGKCDVFCPYANTKDKDDECEAWRTIQKVRQMEGNMTTEELIDIYIECAEINNGRP